MNKYSRLRFMPAALFALICVLASSAVLHAAGTRYEPEWASIAPKRVIKHTTVDGAALVIAAGAYSVYRLWDIAVSGTAKAPLWIVAEEGAEIVLYSRDENAISFPAGARAWPSPATSLWASPPKEGTFAGRGLQDFTSVTWDGEKHDATPSPKHPSTKRMQNTSWKRISQAQSARSRPEEL